MFFSRIRLHSRAASDPGFFARVADAYEAHSLVWDLFSDGPDRERDFLYRQESHEGLPAFYTLSERRPADRNGTWIVESKEFAPRLKAGQRLGFMLRANPIRSSWDLTTKKHHRHDVVMAAKRRLKEAEPDRTRWPTEPELVREAGLAWLAQRAERCGFTFGPGEVGADGYRQLVFRKTQVARPIQISTIDYTGILTVTEPGVFIGALQAGIGPAKGFGCGLLLVRPA
ncbi:MAG: type I-E CRISPR-associated protein Cas6/Cse3/CasE [Methanospirillum sp.]|nr:type I-E CRISPR-associated protein Cas6/Cse3/CasE [Methanospirillum sp.]